ncbi:MAG: YbjN domain-containing protein [Coriobacteriia bacterium]|nr:YbjN domain-containing protein [Coriobacteriia bacterium]
MPDVKEQVNEVGLELTARGISYEYIDSFDRPAIGMAFGGGDYQFSNLAITVAFDEDGESAQIVSSPIANVPAAKTSKLLMVLNQCNCDFRWVKFYMDEDYDIIADADVVFGDDNAGFAVVEAVLLAASVVDDAYPEIMRGIWG